VDRGLRAVRSPRLRWPWPTDTASVRGDSSATLADALSSSAACLESERSRHRDRRRRSMIPDRSLRCALAGRPLRRFRCRTRRNASLTGRAPPIVMQKLQHNKVSSFSDRLDCAAVEGSSVDDLLKLLCRNDRGYTGAELISDAPSMGDDRPPAAQQACDEGRERRRRARGALLQHQNSRLAGSAADCRRSPPLLSLRFRTSSASSGTRR